MKMSEPTWLLLIINLPGQNKTPRMRIWRALKSAGAGLLRDGVYVLPKTAASRKVFEEQVREIHGIRGSAHILAFAADSSAQGRALVELFNRSADYRALNARLEAGRRNLAKLTELDARRALAALARDAAAAAAIDFFPGKSRDQLRSALADSEAALNARFSPGEPRFAQRRIARRDAKDYRGRTWATRRHPWIDRVCSAWLIRRRIDPQARFLWLKRIKDRPRRAVGFDFDGAEFSHVGAKVTFEVLLASFGLEGDPGLARFGALVHYLDVGGIPVAEAPGLAAIVAGARALQPDDDALLRSVFPALDGLYRSYRVSPDGSASRSR